MQKFSVSNVFVHTIHRHRGMSLGLLLSVIAATIFGLLPALILGMIVDHLTDHQAVTFTFVLLYFAVTVANGLSSSLKEVFITIFGQKITHELRTAMSTKLGRLPTVYLTSKSSGDLSSIIVNDVDTIEDLFSSGIFSMIADLTSVISILIVIFTKSIGLGLLLLIALPLLFAFTRWVQKRMLKAQVDNRKAIGKENAHIPETIRNRRTIHVFHAENFMENKYSRYINDSFKAMEHANFFDACYSPIIITSSAVIIGIMMSLTGAGAAFRALFGMSVGSAVTLIAYVNQIFSPLESIGMEIQNIQSAAAGIVRIQAFLSEKEKATPADSDYDEEMPAVTVDHLHFGYGQDEVLKGIRLTIQKGEHVTLAGRTGCGKSTLLKLILGLYAPQSGSVRVFGKESASISDTDRRQIFGYVEQNFVPVAGTLRDCLSLGDARVSDAAIREALETAGITQAVEKCPQGLNTPYDPALFSEGQWQLFSVARAIVLNPPILLLDEITAHLDSATEKQLNIALNKAAQGRTVISVSHRLYQSASRVIEMSQL